MIDIVISTYLGFASAFVICALFSFILDKVCPNPVWAMYEELGSPQYLPPIEAYEPEPLSLPLREKKREPNYELLNKFPQLL